MGISLGFVSFKLLSFLRRKEEKGKKRGLRFLRHSCDGFNEFSLSR